MKLQVTTGRKLITDFLNAEIRQQYRSIYRYCQLRPFTATRVGKFLKHEKDITLDQFLKHLAATELKMTLYSHDSGTQVIITPDDFRQLVADLK